jgi:histone-arginine methyltransferase CARM1
MDLSSSIPITGDSASFGSSGSTGGMEDFLEDLQLNAAATKSSPAAASSASAAMGPSATSVAPAAVIFTPSEPSDNTLTLSTHPSQPITHWQQVRFLLSEPLAVNRGDVIMGRVHMKANPMRSYSITGEFWLKAAADNDDSPRPGTHRRACWELQDQLYNYSNVRPDVSHEWFGMYNMNNLHNNTSNGNHNNNNNTNYSNTCYKNFSNSNHQQTST